MKPQRRLGISEVMAAVITIAITLVAGAALYGFINGQAGASENNLGVANAANVNFLNERFVVPQVAYSVLGGSVAVYFYNNGQVADGFASIEIYCSRTSAGLPCRSDFDITYYVHRGNNYVIDNNDVQKVACNATASGLESPLLNTFSVPVGSVSLVSFTLPQSSWPCVSNGPFTSGYVYAFEVVGQFGNIATYYQEM